MKYGTHNDSPKLKLVSKSWEVLDLKFIEGAVPTQISLCSAVVIANEDEEHDDVGDCKPKCD